MGAEYTASKRSVTSLFSYRSATFILALLAVLAGGLAYYFYVQVRDNPQIAQQREVDELVANVAKLIVLPTDEQPVVATVADPDQLNNQLFFANAKKGDKVLIYNNARKVILYDPVEHRIIEVAPLNIGTPTPSPTP